MILKYLTGGLAFVCLMLGIALHMERRAHAKANDRIATLTAKLEAISTARDEQRQATDRNIAKAHEGQEQAKVITRIIHDAPLPADCGTPALETARDVL
jgi:hypothetical protein